MENSVQNVVVMRTWADFGADRLKLAPQRKTQFNENEQNFDLFVPSFNNFLSFFFFYSTHHLIKGLFTKKIRQSPSIYENSKIHLKVKVSKSAPLRPTEVKN